MFIQIVLFLALIALVYFVSVKKAVDELGGEESAKLGTGVAQMILGFILFFIIGEDETLVDMKEDLALLYYLMRYAFLFDGIYGIGQVCIAVVKRIDNVKDAAESVSKQGQQGCQMRNEFAVNNVHAWHNGQNHPNTAQSQGYVPAWKRVQDQQNEETKV